MEEIQDSQLHVEHTDSTQSQVTLDPKASGSTEPIEVIEEQDPKRPLDVQLAWKLKQEAQSRFKYEPAKGMDWNPLRKYPRNIACFCGSGIKFKKCHEPLLAECIPAEKVPDMVRFVAEMTKEVLFLKDRGVVFKNDPAAEPPILPGHDTLKQSTESPEPIDTEAHSPPD